MLDFVKCLQERNLLQTGEYMVISVDDEIYNPRKHSDIMKRGKKRVHRLLNMEQFF